MIDETRIRVSASEDGVRIVGEPGSVPEEMTVTVTNLDTGDVASTVSDDVGAFDLALDGTTEDEFEVKVGNSSATVDGESNAAPALETCERVSERALELTEQIESRAKQGCGTDEDCVEAVGEAACSAFLCGYRFDVVRDSEGEILSAIGAAEDEVCSAEAKLGCAFGVGALCENPDLSNYALVCVEGTCVQPDPRTPCTFDGYAATMLPEAATFCGDVFQTNQADSPATPEDLESEAYGCFRDALAACRPAFLRMSGVATEGGVITTDLVVSTDGESCDVQAFRDARRDAFGPGSATWSRCTGLLPSSGSEVPQGRNCEVVAICGPPFRP